MKFSNIVISVLNVEQSHAAVSMVLDLGSENTALSIESLIYSASGHAVLNQAAIQNRPHSNSNLSYLRKITALKEILIQDRCLV